MSNFSIANIRNNMKICEFYEARSAFNELRAIEKEEPFAVAMLYQLGIARGKQMERARRKGGAVA